MKKFICLITAVAVAVVGIKFIKENVGDISSAVSAADESTSYQASVDNSESAVSASTAKALSEMHGVWFSYTEISSLVKGKTEEEYRAALEGAFAELEKSKINTVFYQARAFCDALYSSDIFPASNYICTDGVEASFDPLEIFTETGEKYGLSVHAWVNPFRVSYSADYEKLSEGSPARRLYELDKSSLFICETGIFLNPANDGARGLVLDGVRELLENYDIDGIHFDDYFYPDCEVEDTADFGLYKNAGGRLSLEQWRRECVSVLVGSVYSLIKSQSEDLLFGISPAGDINKCMNVYFADVEKWLGEEGFADYIIPQLYFGFENEKLPFEATAKAWENLAGKSTVQLICGFAPYKCGKTDENAGSGETEWQENSDILARQYKYISSSSRWNGFCLFSYSYSFGENTKGISKLEIKNLVDMLR